MAQALVSMAGPSRSTRFDGSSTGRPLITRHRSLSVRCHQSDSNRRALLGLFAAGFVSTSLVRESLADEPKTIKIGPAPSPSGGLSGTKNTDEATDLDLPLKQRFYIQPLPVDKAAERAKESAKEIVGVKELIEKKQWPYVQNDLRLRAGYLRYDLDKVISSKPKEEKKPLKQLTGKLFNTISDLDYAARMKNSTMAEKYYSETVSTLNDVLTQIG